jgi:hypothetical protein
MGTTKNALLWHPISTSISPIETLSVSVLNFLSKCWVLKVERLSSTNKGGKKMMSVTRRHIASGTENLVNQ